jgi:hypothetical protein
MKKKIGLGWCGNSHSQQIRPYVSAKLNVIELEK